MGIIASKLWHAIFGYDEKKIIIVGLNNAGKTTTLYKLYENSCHIMSTMSLFLLIRLLDEVVVTTPTIGSNVEEIMYKNIRFLMWDIGGQGE
jgi:GTPase SAR1 family protein